MLYEIESPPTEQNAAILLHPKDNVAIARVPLSRGQQLDVAGKSITVRSPVPAGHKLALRAIRPENKFIVTGMRSEQPRRKSKPENTFTRRIWASRNGIQRTIFLFPRSGRALLPAAQRF